MDIRDDLSAADLLAICEAPIAAAGAAAELAHSILLRMSDRPTAWGSDIQLLLAGPDESPLALVTRTGTFPSLITGFAPPAAIDFSRLAAALRPDHSRAPLVNGAREWSTPLATELGKLRSSEPEAVVSMIAHQLRELIPPARPPAGSPRPATPADFDLVLEWSLAFSREALDDDDGPDDLGPPTQRRLERGTLLLWEVDGRPVSMADAGARTPNGPRVALVYTPPEHRGNGYATGVVHAITQRALDDGARWCSLFTDAANPTSNRIYRALGYEPQCEFSMYRVP